MQGVDLAKIEYLAFFLNKLKVKIHPEFVILFRRKRAAACKTHKGTWAQWNLEISKLLKEDELNWKWDITGEE